MRSNALTSNARDAAHSSISFIETLPVRFDARVARTFRHSLTNNRDYVQLIKVRRVRRNSGSRILDAITRNTTREITTLIPSTRRGGRRDTDNCVSVKTRRRGAMRRRRNRVIAYARDAPLIACLFLHISPELNKRTELRKNRGIYARYYNTSP